MASSPELSSPETEVTFARNLGLFDATMIGIGAMIGAGIFVLTGIAAGEAGPGALLAFALRKLYQTSAATDLPGRWRRYIPEVSCCANLVLLFTLDWVSIVFGLQLMGVGFLIYFFYSRKREVRARTGMSLVLSEQHKSEHRSNFRILVPMANPQTQPALFAISESLLPENYTAEQKAHSSKKSWWKPSGITAQNPYTGLKSQAPTGRWISWSSALPILISSLWGPPKLIPI
jgi:hypothetical protein